MQWFFIIAVSRVAVHGAYQAKSQYYVARLSFNDFHVYFIFFNYNVVNIPVYLRRLAIMKFTLVDLLIISALFSIKISILFISSFWTEEVKYKVLLNLYFGAALLLS